MGLLGIHSKSNLGKTRFDAALLCLLFISIYQTYSLISQGFPWLSVLFVLAGGCQLFFLINSQKKKLNKYAALLCVGLSWVAVLTSNCDKSLVIPDWFFILIITGYLLLTLTLANTLNSIGLVSLLCLQYFEQNSSGNVIQLLPLFILLIIANLLGSQNAYLTSAFKRSQVSDALTGCANREHFMQEIMKSSDIYCRYKINMSLIALKMDLSSEEVEMLGREKFDKCQVSLSQIWASRIRNTDILCRYHDGLFLVLLPSTPLENALSLANDLTKASGDYEYDRDVNIKIQTKTVAHDGIENWETWFNRAAL
jgi:diguanylate cyclase (GGDEF)-like protein